MRRRLLLVVLLVAIVISPATATHLAPSNVQATVNSLTSVTITWNAVADGETYEVLRSTGGPYGLIGSSTSTRFIDGTAVANTMYRYQVRVVGGPSSAAVYAGTFSFTDDPLVATTTQVKAAHITELRTDVNAMRAFGGLSAATFTDPTLTTSTPIRAAHITELRTALNGARTALGMATITFTDGSLTQFATTIRADHVRELRGGTRQASTSGALLNGPPLFTSSTTPSVPENTTAVMTVTTTDPELNPRTYAIFGGADAAKFSIHATSGALSFLSAPNFESPDDAGGNNVYDVIVSASDGQGNVAATAIAVTVTNVVNEGPVFTSPSSVSTTELVEDVFHTVTATDGANTVTFSITGGADQGDLSITSSGGVSFNTPPDFFAPADANGNNVYVVEVTANSTGGGSAVQTLSVTVTQMTCVSLSLGGVSTSVTPVPKTFCLAGGAEYTLVTSNVSSNSALTVNLTGTGIVAVTGPPTPMSAEPRSSDFEWDLRMREREEMPERLRSEPRAMRVRGDAITPGVPSVGTVMDINVETDNSCSTNDIRKARVKVVGTHVIVMEEVDSGGVNPVISGGLTTADYQAFADEFDNVIRPAVNAAFGPPADIDSNSRVIVFFTSAVNQLTPNGGTLVDGFFFSRDLSPAAQCATSNVGEMIYTLMADPTGSINGNVRSVSFVKERTPRTIAHEIEHLINASRRMYVNTPFVALEEVWLDEGLAHVSEELVFYQKASLTPRSNLSATEVGGAIDPFFQYAEPNFARLRAWLISPHTSGLAQTDNDDATRGAAWAFLRYASDRRGGTESTFWQGLVNTQQTGLTNLQTNLGTDPAPWFADFGMTTYSDDATTGVTSQFSHGSWNFRDLYANLDYDPGPACSCAYELSTRNPSSGVTDGFTLTGIGSAAFSRMGVAGGGRAIIKARGAGNSQLPSTVQLRIFRRE